MPGLLTCPEMQNRRVPPFFGEPSPRTILRRRRRMIQGTKQSVSTLLITVGRAVQAHHGREGRPDARIAALAFERFHQRRFFAALVGARAGMRQQIEIEARCPEYFCRDTRARKLRRSRRPRCPARSDTRRECRCIRDARRSARPAMTMPSISWCGTISISGRSLHVPGSLSSALQRSISASANPWARSSTSCPWESPRRRGRAGSTSSLRRSPARASISFSALSSPL